MNLRNAFRGLIVSALLSALVYAVLAAVSDARAVTAALESLPVSTIAAIVALALGCYVIRAARWRYLLKVTGHQVSMLDAAYMQFAGMTMTVTPGKVGEVLKAFLARELADLPMARGVALVFSERLADVVAVTALSAGAVGTFTKSGPALAAAVLALAAGITLLSSERFHRIALSVAFRQHWMREHRESAGAVSETIRWTLALKRLAVSVLLSVAAWGCEGVAFALCVRTLGLATMSVPTAVAIYAISTLAGALTFLPGGIGLTEASLAGLLVAAGMASGAASAATLLIRVITLWFGVALGWAALATRPAIVKALVRIDGQS